MITHSLSTSLYLYFARKEAKHTINKVKDDLTDSIFFQIFYRYRSNIVIMNSFGHDNHVVKIWYCDSWYCVQLIVLSPSGQISYCRFRALIFNMFLFCFFLKWPQCPKEVNKRLIYQYIFYIFMWPFILQNVHESWT